MARTHGIDASVRKALRSALSDAPSKAHGHAISKSRHQARSNGLGLRQSAPLAIHVSMMLLPLIAAPIANGEPWLDALSHSGRTPAEVWTNDVQIRHTGTCDDDRPEMTWGLQTRGSLAQKQYNSSKVVVRKGAAAETVTVENSGPLIERVIDYPVDLCMTTCGEMPTPWLKSALWSVDAVIDGHRIAGSGTFGIASTGLEISYHVHKDRDPTTFFSLTNYGEGLIFEITIEDIASGVRETSRYKKRWISRSIPADKTFSAVEGG